MAAVRTPRFVPLAVLAVAAAGVLAACSGSPAARAAGNRTARTVTAPLGGRQHSELDVLSGATSVAVATAPLGGELLRVSTPAGAGIKADLVVGGTVQLYLDSTGFGGPAAVQITLNSRVSWRLDFSGGSTLTSVYLGRGQLRGADFSAGSSKIIMRLPRPSGTVPIVLAGGASQVILTVPHGVPARLQLDGGASTAVLAGRTYTGIAGGTALTAPGWASAASRYDIQAPAGIASISVGTW
jgi:hypothetical protein